MSELLKVYDPYSDLNKEYYFTQTFNSLPSSLFLEVPMQASKKNMDKVLDLMKISESEYELVLRKWSTDDASDANFERDFPYKLLFKGLNNKLIIWIELENNTLDVGFYYDCKDRITEKFVIDQNDLLRKEFGQSQTPTFKVLTKCGSGFSTQKVRTDKVKIDLNSNYNDGFSEVYNRIDKSIPSKKSGLILLYGKPGTGKTTYIKSLISSHQTANFIFIQNEFVSNLLDPDFISFLLKQRNSILVIEDAEKVISSRENSGQESLVSTILQLTDGLFSDYLNIKVICTFNTALSKIDTALLRKGRLIAIYEFNPLSLEKTNNLLAKLGADQVYDEMSVADIYNYKQKSHDNLKKVSIGFARN